MPNDLSSVLHEASTLSALRTPFNSLLLLGPRECGKTRLVFHFASEEIRSDPSAPSPLIVCNPKRLEGRFPAPIAPISRWSAEVLSRIQMKYVSSLSDLKLLFGGLAHFSPVPSTIFIEDFSSIVDPLNSVSRNDSNFIETCLALVSYLEDSLSHLRLLSGMPRLVITDDCVDCAPYINVMMRSVSLVVKLEDTEDNETILVLTHVDSVKLDLPTVLRRNLFAQGI